MQGMTTNELLGKSVEGTQVDPTKWFFDNENAVWFRKEDIIERLSRPLASTGEQNHMLELKGIIRYRKQLIEELQ